MITAVTSGKGGTGKTTIAVNLAAFLGNSAMLLDCDVEEPNVHIFLKPEGLTLLEDVCVMVPRIDETKCNGCGICSDFCQFNSLAVFGKHVMIFPELCHSCGGCKLVCPEKALSETPKTIGTVETFRSNKVEVVQGRLNIGVAMSGPLIREVKARRQNGGETIIDAPPGTSCPVVESVKGVDAVIVVTEPTPFGLSDLRILVEVLKTISVPFGVVINKSGTSFREVHNFCAEGHIPILGEIAEDISIAEAYSRGKLLLKSISGFEAAINTIWENTKKLVKV